MYHNDKTYLFYDLETSGINHCFDQIVQFAAVRTDINFKEIDRYEFFVRLNPDTLPTAKACITHCISMSYINNGITEYDAIKKIYHLLNTPNTVNFGYNNLSFDDKFLRFSFFRNLLPPYYHQYNNGCSRVDIYPFVIFYYLFCSKILTWPLDAYGKVSLKLDDINVTNNLCEYGNAHEGMHDVLTTIALSKVLKTQCSRAWHYLLFKFNKHLDLKLFLKFSGMCINHVIYHEALMISSMFGYANYCMSFVVSLGQHSIYKNQWCFLRLDVCDLQNIVLEEDNTFFKYLIVNKKWGDIPILLPVKKIFLKYLFFNKKNYLINKNKIFLEKNLKFFTFIKNNAINSVHDMVRDVDNDALLYIDNSALSYNNYTCKLFHNYEIKQKIIMINKIPNVYLERALRIVGRISMNELNIAMYNKFKFYLKNVFNSELHKNPIDYRGLSRTPIQSILEDIKYLRFTNILNSSQIKILDELESYLFMLIAWVKSI